MVVGGLFFSDKVGWLCITCDVFPHLSGSKESLHGWHPSAGCSSPMDTKTLSEVRGRVWPQDVTLLPYWKKLEREREREILYIVVSDNKEYSGPLYIEKKLKE